MILTTDKLTITLTCKLTRPENAKRCLELFRETHRKGHAAFTIAPCDSLRSVFVAVEVTP